jgi:hypothetical protein
MSGAIGALGAIGDGIRANREHVRREEHDPEQAELSPEARGLFDLATAGYRLALDVIERERQLPAVHWCPVCVACGGSCVPVFGHTGNVRAALTAREGTE